MSSGHVFKLEVPGQDSSSKTLGEIDVPSPFKLEVPGQDSSSKTLGEIDVPSPFIPSMLYRFFFVPGFVSS